MAFTEFCCKSGGSNLNAGTRTGSSTEPGNTADFTYASGSWVSATGVFTVASGNPSTDGVAVGDFASVYADGATVTGFVGRVTAVTSSTITVSLTAKSGTAPSDGSGNRTLRIGGAWQGPNGTSLFPIAFVENTCVNASADPVRVNFRGTFNITSTGAAVSGSQYSAITLSGYGTTYGDRTRAEFSWGSTAVDSALIFGTAGNPLIDSIIFSSAATSGNGVGLQCNSRGHIRNCVFTGWRLRGIQIVSAMIVDECEIYACGFTVAINIAGIYVDSTTGALIRNTIVHDCNGHAIHSYTGLHTLLNCIMYSNAGNGIRVGYAFVSNTLNIVGCDFYNNGLSGIDIAASPAAIHVLNSNFVKNGACGIKIATAAAYGVVTNCGFGAGAEANALGDIDAQSSLVVSGSVNYTSHPWRDPANGDFRINDPAAKGTGRGLFVQTTGGSGTVGYPDIGAAQLQGGGSGGFSMSRLVNTGG